MARRSAPDQSSVGISIENLTEDYCDDFVCTSSPAVETSVRQLAKGICTTARWPPRNFAPKVSRFVLLPDRAPRRALTDASLLSSPFPGHFL